MTDKSAKTNDYQNTLNLPKTEFSMRAGLSQKEPARLQHWEENNLEGLIREKSKEKKMFILHDGPPYANGHIHLGHALNKILKDMIVKSKTMDGFDAWYVPGWDCHGLPIEHQIFKELKKRKSEVDTLDFRKKAHEYAMKFVGIQREEFQRLGVFGQWDDPYLTLDPDYESWILKSLAELCRKNFVYRGRKPVNWCVQCETALAEAEVEYENHTSKSVYVKFKVDNPGVVRDMPNNMPVSLLVWTTTPWTLIANVAVAVHPEFTYSIVKAEKECLIVEQTLRDHVLELAGIKTFDVVQDILGKDLTRITYQHPLDMRQQCPVVTADYVTKEDGTGLVHTAPGHGQDDYLTGMKHGLDVVMPVNDRGVYTREAGPYEGQFVFKANDAIIEDLKNRGTLIFSDHLQHSYPHCWRCKTPIIFRATQQWFLNIDHNGLRQTLEGLIQKDVTWIPEAGQERILSMVRSRPDWCLSRQRHWGVPIPALKLKSTEEQKLYPEVIDHFAEIVRREGTDAWFAKEVRDLIPDGFRDPETGETDFEKTYDILDVWFDSGVSSQAVIKGKMGLELPIDMYLEGSDQHRGWFQSSLIPAAAMENKAPYKSVLTHGFVVDGNGRKMSKSLGNVISPQEVIRNSGADILRLWVASSAYNEDIRVSQEILDRLVDAYRKIRNTARYLLGNLYDFEPERHMVEYGQLLELDQWALNRLQAVVRRVRDHYRQYSFANLTKEIFAFCNEDLSNFYLDILKDRLYIPASRSPERSAAQTVLYHTAFHLVQMLAPILAFTADEIFEYLPRTTNTKYLFSAHLLEWNDLPEEWANAGIDERFKLLLSLRPHVMKALENARSEKMIGSSLEAKVVFRTASERDEAYLKSFNGSLADMFVVSQTVVEKQEKIDDGLDEVFGQTQLAIEKAEGRKCARSWKYSTDVGEDPDFPDLSLKNARIVKEMMKHGSEKETR